MEGLGVSIRVRVSLKRRLRLRVSERNGFKVRNKEWFNMEMVR